MAGDDNEKPKTKKTKQNDKEHKNMYDAGNAVGSCNRMQR